MRNTVFWDRFSLTGLFSKICMSREFPNSWAMIRGLCVLPYPVYVPFTWIKVARNLRFFLCRWWWGLVHVPQSYLKSTPVVTGWSRSGGLIRFRRWDKVPRTYCGARWAGRPWTRWLKYLSPLILKQRALLAFCIPISFNFLTYLRDNNYSWIHQGGFP